MKSPRLLFPDRFALQIILHQILLAASKLCQDPRKAKRAGFAELMATALRQPIKCRHSRGWSRASCKYNRSFSVGSAGYAFERGMKLARLGPTYFASCSFRAPLMKSSWVT